ncbi:MAG: MmcQ/YjbR family DNA-binding protein [Planctomycetota bacterium]|nr:MmcQ/YjbR family DNA-binding protein [Planctomycetota bacterium]
MPHHLARVRRICAALPGTTERLSHGEPTFFVHKKVYVMFAANHHDDGRIAVWLPVPGDAQEDLIEAAPKVYFCPPYVGVRGWVGINLDRIAEKKLKAHIHAAWKLLAPKRLLAEFVGARRT